MTTYIGKNIIACGLPEPDVLELDTVLYNGFGGYSVLKNDELYYSGDSDADWEDFKKLADIEKKAERQPDAKWEVVLFSPLEGATWVRNPLNKAWICIERNQGFA
jgi:hypothetical protein